MSKKYTITIEETTAETKLVQGEWMVVEKRPYTKEESLDMSGLYNPENIGHKEVRGYAPDREQEVVSTVKVYEQVVEDIDLVTVITAVNCPSSLMPRGEVDPKL